MKFVLLGVIILAGCFAFAWYRSYREVICLEKRLLRSQVNASDLRDDKSRMEARLAMIVRSLVNRGLSVSDVKHLGTGEVNHLRFNALWGWLYPNSVKARGSHDSDNQVISS